jgi:cellulose synthase/poly-beta-1,6-N-acetylglucosamine synthase-like glycosyltransferase
MSELGLLKLYRRGARKPGGMTSAAPTVAICIPTYNQSQYLAGAVESAVQQTYSACEVWIADDASSDETPEVMERLSRVYPNLRYWRQPKNCGIAGNNNWLLRQPATDFIVRLDSDDTLAPAFVATLMEEMAAHPRAGYAHAAVHEIDQCGTVTRVRRLAGRGKFQDSEAALTAAVSGYRVAANICMFRKVALESCGFYREGMNFAEDWDLSVRMAAAGWGNIYVAEPLACYRWWTDGSTRLRRKISEIEGCQTVFEQSLAPAFAERGWSLTALSAARQRVAKAHAEVLLSPGFTDEEKSEIHQALQRLAPGAALARHIALLKSPIGRFLRMHRKLRLVCADFVKMLLARYRQ